jgi:hypothetical protein
MIKNFGGVFGRNPVFNVIRSALAYAGNLLISDNTITSTNTNGDITLNPNGTGRIVQDAVIATGSGSVLLSEGKTGFAADATPFTAFTITVGANSTTRVEVDVVAIEMTGYIATISRKYVFTLKNRASTLTATAINSIAGFEISESSGNYAITPTVAVTIVDATTATFNVTLTKGGAIGWNSCTYGVRATVNSVKAATIS